MAAPVYERGIIKVVWAEDSPEEIHSQMFDTEEEAKEFAQTKKDYLIFALLHQKNMREFSWKVLPYGRQKFYVNFLRSYLKHKNKFFSLFKS